MQLSAAMQNVLSLPEAPLFLNDCYTATVDRWIDRKTQALQVAATVKPRVWQYRPILQVIFNTPIQHWQLDTTTEGHCDTALLENYRQQFPQLWHHHNLVLRLDHLPTFRYIASPDLPTTLSGYVLRLFVRGQTSTTIEALESLHQLLEQTLTCPYTLRVVDVQQHPDLAEQDNVTATPTLIKTWPPPIRRFVGTLDRKDRILKLLDLT